MKEFFRPASGIINENGKRKKIEFLQNLSDKKFQTINMTVGINESQKAECTIVSLFEAHLNTSFTLFYILILYMRKIGYNM